jgi:hypothetical protein
LVGVAGRPAKRRAAEKERERVREREREKREGGGGRRDPPLPVGVREGEGGREERKIHHTP